MIINDPIKKIGNVHRQFEENETQITLKHINKRIRKMKIKTTLIHYSLPIRWARIQKINNTTWPGSGETGIFVCC